MQSSVHALSKTKQSNRPAEARPAEASSSSCSTIMDPSSDREPETSIAMRVSHGNNQVETFLWSLLVFL